MNIKDHMCFPLSLPSCVSYTKFLVGSFLAPSVKSQESGNVDDIYIRGKKHVIFSCPEQL